MPASTLSRRISMLESRIGVRLLNRSTRKVELTEAGAVYFERCQHVIAEARIAHEELDEMAQRPKGRLRVSMPVSFALLSMRSEEHTSELQSLMRISYAVFCLKKTITYKYTMKTPHLRQTHH